MTLTKESTKVFDAIEEMLNLQDKQRKNYGLTIIAILDEFKAKKIELTKAQKNQALRIMNRCDAGSIAQRLESLVDEESFRYAANRNNLSHLYDTLLKKGF